MYLFILVNQLYLNNPSLNLQFAYFFLPNIGSIISDPWNLFMTRKLMGSVCFLVMILVKLSFLTLLNLKVHLYIIYFIVQEDMDMDVDS